MNKANKTRRSAAHPAATENLCLDSGFLQQRVLVILDFPPEGKPDALTSSEETHIANQLDIASDFFWLNSSQSLRVHFHRIKVLRTLEVDDYQTYGTSGAAAKYTNAIHQSLLHRKVDPKQFSGLIMIYRPTNAPSTLFNNTWVWFNDNLSSTKRNPGFSSVVFNDTNFLSEVVIHEYLHQLDHRFEHEAGNPDPAQHGFMNPDDKDNPAGIRLAQLLGATAPFPTAVDYYKAMLKYYVTVANQLRHVNYHWLEGIRGVFYDAEVRKLYDFNDPDAALVYMAGDNIAQTQPGNLASFWFRALPNHTAAFRTQTASGRFILKSVSFNYEIAPGDNTFQVLLIYCDIRDGIVQKRIDDGIYKLGRQLFRTNRKKVEVNLEVGNFQIAFQKGNLLLGNAASDDWLLLGKIVLDLAIAA